MNAPLVSAITIFFNGEDFIKEAIESVLAQTYANWELLLVDDGSSDGSTEIARRYEKAHPGKIRYLDHICHQNRGMSASRNLGLRHAKGEYIAFLDHDDIWLQNKLEDQVAILESLPEAAMMYGRTRYWHGWTGRQQDSERDGFTFLGVEPNRIVAPPQLFTLFLGDDDTIASTCSVLIRREIAERVGGFDEAFRDQYEDMVFLAKIYLEFPVYVSDRCWDYYRQHDNNSGKAAIRTGQWHPTRPNPAREKFLNRLEQYLLEKAVTDVKLLEALKTELSPYRSRGQRAPGQVFRDLCSDAALALLRGEDARPLIGTLGNMREAELSGDAVAEWFFDVVPPPRIGDAHVWTRRWPNLKTRVDRFMEALEIQSQAPGLAEDAIKALERWIHNQWFLRVAENAVARLEFPGDNPDSIRVAISKEVVGNSYDVQLNQAHFQVKANHRYLLTFLARADQQRNLSFGFAKAHEPWTNLGLYCEISLASDWQSFEETFVAAEDEDRARLHFDLGGCDISVELSAVGLRSLSEGRYVDPVLLLPQDNFVVETALDESVIPVGEVQFGSFLRVTPISRNWGWDRGIPINRYYIENFLARHSGDIRGHVLEIGDASYSQRLGGDRVTRIDVLAIQAEEDPQVTIVANLEDAPEIPSNTFDCIIFTQTLQLIYNAPAAIQTLHRILKPGGVLLATFPGISQTNDVDWAQIWYWNFTSSSAWKLFHSVFSPTEVTIESFGNVLSAISFLHGLSAGELTRNELETTDPGYEVTIVVRASKAVVDAVPDSGERQRKAAGQRAKPSEPGALILMYHRVTEVETDPFSLCVSPQHFSEHMNILRKEAKPMRLQQLAAQIRSGTLPPRSVVLTFDDGYADNLYNAKPMLERYQIPATVFVTTGNLGQEREFWWDELDRLFLQPGILPARLCLNLQGIVHEWELGEAAHYSAAASRQYRNWRAGEDEAFTPRHAVYFSVWKLLQLLSESERRAALNQLVSWAGDGSKSRRDYRSLTPQELLALAEGDLVEIGAHTVTHPALCELSVDSQRNEVQQSKDQLEEILSRPVTSFAYPYGDLSDEVAAVVRNAGFNCSCSTVIGLVDHDSDLYRLPRVQVEDWDGDEFGRRLATWFGGPDVQ